MKVTQESINNFRRAPLNSTLMGIRDMRTNRIHLALQSVRGAENFEGQLSTIEGNTVNPLPRNQGHSVLARHAGLPVTSVPLRATGPAIGFTIEKTGNNTYEVTSWQSGLNTQAAYLDTRPPQLGASFFDRHLGMDHRAPIMNDLDLAMRPLIRRPFTRLKRFMKFGQRPDIDQG